MDTTKHVKMWLCKDEPLNAINPYNMAYLSAEYPHNQNKKGWTASGEMIHAPHACTEWVDTESVEQVAIMPVKEYADIMARAHRQSRRADQMTERDPFRAICREIADLQARKNHDYGNAFARTFKRFGMTSAVIRLTDKLNRLETLCNTEQHVTDESVRDTLRDLAAYAIMTIAEIDQIATQ